MEVKNIVDRKLWAENLCGCEVWCSRNNNEKLGLKNGQNDMSRKTE